MSRQKELGTLPDIPPEGNDEWYSHEETMRRMQNVLGNLLNTPPYGKPSKKHARRPARKTQSRNRAP